METTKAARTLIGILFLTIGTILLLRFLDILTFTIPHYVFSWKTLLMALGVVFIFTEKNKSTGVIFFTVGAVFLARDILRVDFYTIMQVAIPLLLLIIGLVILMPRHYRNKRDYNQRSFEDSQDSLNELNIFSGANKNIVSDNFKGGEITCIFGGSEMNFKNTNLAIGNNVLEATCIFGGVTLYIPEDWTVVVETTNIFGDFTDSRYKRIVGMSTDPEKVLYVKGVMIFGGGEIKLA